MSKSPGKNHGNKTIREEHLEVAILDRNLDGRKFRRILCPEIKERLAELCIIAMMGTPKNRVFWKPRFFIVPHVKNCMEKRIFGVEIEYGIIFTSQGRKTLPVEKIVRYLFEQLVTTEGFLNVFLENGARFYQDTGYHPEYATPECTNPIDLLRFEKGWRSDFGTTRQHAEERLQHEGIAGSLNIYKNNTDFIGNSYGCRNYC